MEKFFLDQSPLDEKLKNEAVERMDLKNRYTAEMRTYFSLERNKEIMETDLQNFENSVQSLKEVIKDLKKIETIAKVKSQILRTEESIINMRAILKEFSDKMEEAKENIKKYYLEKENIKINFSIEKDENKIKKN